jgi:hypothetical protein
MDSALAVFFLEVGVLIFGTFAISNSQKTGEHVRYLRDWK